ncbi:MAG: hypothetical protein CXR31_15455 [Geobacter sp.]|nr:MAG: hypothetical protein CXR31_15455 [Geobacter sp.]
MGTVNTSSAEWGKVTRTTCSIKVQPFDSRGWDFVDSTVTMTCNVTAPAASQRIREGDRAYAIMFGSTAMASLATGFIRVMCRAEKFWKKCGP